MVLPVLAHEAGSYHERPVGEALRDHFSCVWVNHLSESSTAPFVVVPDGAIDLQWIDGRWRVAGPDRVPHTEVLPAGSMVIGFRFQPGSASAWLGAAASQLRDERVWLADVWGFAGRQADAAGKSSKPQSQILALQNILARRASATPLPDHEMRMAHRLIANGSLPGTHVIPWMTTELGLSERTLRRRFDAAFGYGPKTLDRILRFQRYLKLLRSRPSDSAARLAAAAGYADQPHLIRECLRLTLRTPGRLS